MDNLQPQSGGPPLPEGHDDSDLNIRGVVWFGAFLAIGGVMAFLLMGLAMKYLERWEKNHEAKLTPVQQQLQAERDKPRDPDKGPAAEEPVKPAPDWYGRGKIEEHLGRTFATPRVQYDDEHDMNNFRGSENEWLGSTGKTANGNIHIPINRAMELLVKQGLPPVSGPFLPANASAPSAEIPNGGVEPRPARANPRANRGGAKP
jgi:hypothetical protein